MPSYHRASSPDCSFAPYPSTPTSPSTYSTYTYSTGFASPKLDQSPSFAMISTATPKLQTPTNVQLWTLYHFENHATTCASCHHPYHVHRAGSRLCRTGRHLAHSCADLLGNGISRRLELPETYVQVKSLVRAMERSLRHPRQAPIVRLSDDKHESSTLSTAIALARPARKAVLDPKKTTTTTTDAATTSPSRKSKSFSSKPRKHERLESPAPSATITTSARSSSSRPSETPDLKPLKSILKPTTPPRAPTPPPAVRDEEPFYDALAAASARQKRRHSPNPTILAPSKTVTAPTSNAGFSVELREPRKKLRAHFDV